MKFSNHFFIGLAVALVLVQIMGCGTSGSQKNQGSVATSGKAPTATPSQTSAESPGEWVLAYRETFDGLKLPKDPRWAENSLEEQDKYSDNGSYFRKKIQGFKVPRSFRISHSFGKDGWLTLESYTRDPSTHLLALAGVESDPGDADNKVLRITSLRHTDGTVVRPTNALPKEYRVCVRGGFADFGTGYMDSSNNGYEGNEDAGPWVSASALSDNGLYWLSILSDVPRPRNNVWIHHHRKAVIDSDNNSYPISEGGPSFTHIWDGKRFVQSGEHPVMMFVVDRENKSSVLDYDRAGQPFISFAAGRWNSEAEVKQIRAVDAYRERTWYDVCIEKTANSFRLTMTGDFRNGGQKTYDALIEGSRVFNFEGTPDYFMFGDPHVNYYRGLAYFDDIRLYVRPDSN